MCIFVLPPHDQLPPATEKQKALRKRRTFTSFSLISRQTRISRETCLSWLSRLSLGSLVTWGSGRTGRAGRVAAVPRGHLVEHHFNSGHLTWSRWTSRVEIHPRANTPSWFPEDEEHCSLLMSCSQTCLATERIMCWDATSPWKPKRIACWDQHRFRTDCGEVSNLNVPVLPSLPWVQQVPVTAISSVRTIYNLHIPFYCNLTPILTGFPGSPGFPGFPVIPGTPGFPGLPCIGRQKVNSHHLTRGATSNI